MSDIQSSYDESNMVMTISFNRPNKSNALTPSMIQDLYILLKRIDSAFSHRVLNQAKSSDFDAATPVVRALILTAEGKFFCSGMDLKAARENRSSTTNNTEQIIALFDTIQSMSMPTIAMLNGPAMGGGTVFMFACDFIFMKNDCFIQFSEVNIGILPAMISCYIVPRIGRSLATTMMLSGRRYSAKELSLYSQIPIVDCQSSTLAQLERVTMTFVTEHLLTSSSFASSHMKRLIDYVCTHAHDENKAEAQLAFKKCFASEDMTFGLMSFKNKQKPDWTQFLKSKL